MTITRRVFEWCKRNNVDPFVVRVPSGTAIRIVEELGLEKAQQVHTAICSIKDSKKYQELWLADKHETLVVQKRKPIKVGQRTTIKDFFSAIDPHLVPIEQLFEFLKKETIELEERERNINLLWKVFEERARIRACHPRSINNVLKFILLHSLLNPSRTKEMVFIISGFTREVEECYFEMAHFLEKRLHLFGAGRLGWLKDDSRAFWMKRKCQKDGYFFERSFIGIESTDALRWSLKRIREKLEGQGVSLKKRVDTIFLLRGEKGIIDKAKIELFKEFSRKGNIFIFFDYSDREKATEFGEVGTATKKDKLLYINPRKNRRVVYEMEDETKVEDE